jgi:hypothetical protein
MLLKGGAGKNGAALLKVFSSERLPEKKRDLDFSSVPAHDDECNCAEADQRDQGTVSG